MSATQPDFSLDPFRKRHGEAALQALLEDWERHFGQKVQQGMSLEERWNRLVANDRREENATRAA